jgi:hypothetical protein
LGGEIDQTALLNKVKQMGFEEASEGYQAKRISQTEAVVLLGIYDRSF